MPDEKIVFYQLLEKLYGTGAVRERMEHFEINPGFIVIYLKRRVFLSLIYRFRQGGSDSSFTTGFNSLFSR